MLLTQLLTPDWLIKRYLLDLDQFDTNGQLTGVPTGQNGQPFPDAMYQEQVRASTDRAEKQYDLIVKDLIQVTGERQSDTNWQTNDFVSFTLDKRPVRRLTRVQVQVGNFPPTDVPLDWWEIVDGDLGQVRLMPGVQSWAVSASGNIVMLMLQRQYQPGIWRFDYTAGFDGIEGMTATDVKRYIRFIADRRLQQLSLQPIYRADAKNPLPWMDQMLNAIEHTNFFENRATEYSKASTRGSWEEAFA